MGERMSEKTDAGSATMTGRQRFWLVTYWAGLALVLVLLAAGFAAVTVAAIRHDGWLDFTDPLMLAGLGCLVASWLIEIVVVGQAKKRRPVTDRMAGKISRLAERRRREVLGKDLEVLIALRALPANLHGRMWRTQIMVQRNCQSDKTITITLPALGTRDGRERRFVLIRDKVPAWLTAAYPGYRFHARVNLPDLEETTGWGYIIDFEPYHAAATDRTS